MRAAALLSIPRLPERKVPLEPLPDLGSLSDADLKQLIDELTKEEREVSYRRRILHGKSDILRAELQDRLKRTGGRSVLGQGDGDRLAAILAGKAVPPVADD